ncbi:uncharacterized protein [Apostichopus japonicus]|uniref:uncharacterized protein isoform X38 n=1 Tax=Stichopus japonicus TaxID=307972 RepID=UPI003AB377B4
MSSSLRIGVAPSESFTIEKDASEGKENGPSTDKVDDKPSKPQKPSKMRTDDDGKPSMENVDLDQFREAAIKAGYEDVANYYAKKTDGNASFLRAARAGNLEKVLEYLKGSTDINTSNANGLNALHLSSKEGHLNIVTELLKRGANVNAATKKGNTALHIGALAGQEEIVKVLIEHGADVNVQSQNGFTPLYMAAQENHTGVVKYLLSHSADQNLATEDGFLPIDVATQQGHDIVVETLLQHSRPQYPQKAEDGFTPLAVALQQGHDKVVAVLLENDRAGKTRLPALHIAARKDDTKAAALLLQSGHNPDVTSKSGFTPLHIAAHYGHVTVATLLLQKGATVDYSARNHITPLHVAAKWGKVNMVNTLLDRGAKIDAKTRDGLTPLHCSARSGHDQCVDQLLERGAPISTKTKSGLAPLHMAAQGDHVDSARLLLFHKAPVDDVTVDYLTPLHVAAHCGHHRVAKLLLDRKATADARALNGFTPLHIACKKNRIKVIELLLKYGASIHATTESGLTPLHAAAFMGNVQIVPYLIKNGAKVNVTNVRGETPLHLAARSNQIDVMKILIDNGATVDACAHENQTPLHIAARLGNAEIVTLLLEKGANADAQTRDQYTALHIAAREGKEDVAAVLLDRGATLSMKTKKDFTPLHVAAKYGRLEVASLLLRNYAAPDAKAQNGLTPLHIAAHYDNVDVAMLLLDHGASPHTAAKNGFTPLHIAAKKNQMDVATTLLEYGAEPNATTKHGISPVHLAALEGHSDMLSLLLERGAKPDIVSKNGLTPLHLAAQEDQLNCAVILVNSKAEIDPKTKAGYTPLHVACHHGNIKTATYLLEHDASVHEKTKHGLTPLHQGAQQGHVGIVNILLAHSADPNEKANNGYTPLAIAKRLGYISVVNTLTIVTEETTVVISPNDEKLKVQVPETMQINFMSDSDDEADGDGDDVSMTGDQLLLSPQEIRTMGDDSITARKSWEDDWMREPNMNYFSGIGSLSGHYSMTSPSGHLSVTSPSGYSTLDSRYGGDRSMNGDVTINGEAPILASSEIMVESSAPMLESTPQRQISGDGDKEGPRSIPSFHGFLISFIVDARGGTMRSKRLPGLRLVVPPKRASGPTRVTCRLIKRTKLQTPPPLVENESLSTRVIEVGPSNTQFLGGLGNKLVTYPPLNDGETMVSRILEMGPATEKFLRPVLLEVPHFASLRGNEREIVVLRSDNGESWREHSLGATEEEVKKTMDGYELEDNNVPSDKRICRIITKDFPQYFAIISRVRQETNIIGTQGGMLNSTVVPQVQAVFPEGTLTKKIKVGLQAQPVSNDAVKKVLGNRVMVSPIVTIEPRRRKFHKPITVTIPVPTAYNQGVNTYGGDTPTLRLLCSISGGTAPAQWEDITGTTPLTFVNDCVSFTTTVSARFWLMDCKEIDQASNFARELYQELKAVPFMSKFVVFAKTHDPIEARVRVFCVTDDKIDKPLEQKEEFKEVARSKDVEVLDGRPVFIELAGNLVPVQKSGEQLHLNFHAFHENRLPFFVRMRDQTQEPCGRLSFMREPRVQRGLPPQVSVCNLNVTMPAYVKVKKATDSESESESESEDEDYKMEKGEREQYHQTKEMYSLTKVEFTHKDILLSNLNFDYIKDKKKYTFPDEASRGPGTGDKPEIILWDVANKMGSDWPALGRELGINNREIKLIENENDDLPEQAFVLLHLWAERQSPAASTSQLADALQAIGRGDIVDQCLPEDKPLDVTVTTSRQAYSPLRGDLDSPKDGTADITIDITGDEEPGFEELKQEITDEKDAGARSPTDDVTVKHAEIEVTPEELENVIQDQAKTEDIDEQIEKHVKEQKEYEIPGEKREDSTPGDKQEEPQDVEDTGEPSDDKKQPIQQEITTIKTKQKVVHFEEHVYVETGRASLPVDDEDQVIITTDHEQDNVVDDAVTPHEDVIVEHEPEVEKEPEVEEEPAAVDKVTDEPEATAYEVHEDIRDKEDLEDRVEADLEEDRQAEQMSEVEKETKVDDLPEAEQEEVVAPEVGSEPAEDKTEVEETPESREEVVKEITVDETADVHEEPEAEEEIKKDAVVEEQETIEDKLTLEEESKELAEEKVDDDVEDIKVTEVETTILVTSKVEKISEVVLDQEDPQIETDIAPQMKKELLPDGPLVEEQVEEVVEDELQKVDAETSKEEELVEPVDDTPKFMEETPTHEEQLEEKNVIPDIVSESKEAPVSHEEPDEVRNVEEASQDYKQFEIQSSERIVIESSQSFDEREPLSEPVDKDDEESKEETLESSEVQTVETVTVTDKIVVEEKTVTSQGEAPTDMLEDEDVAQKASSEEKTNHDESAENKDLDDVIDTNELKNVETTQESVVSEQITTVHVHAELTEERGMAQEPNTMKDEVDPNNFPKELAEKVEQTEYKEGASTVEEVSKQPEPVVEERAETPEERETKPQDELNMEETAPVTDQSITEDKASTPVEERETIETQEKVILVEELSKEQDDDTKQDKGGSYAVMDEPSMESQPIGEATSVHVYAEKTTLVVHDDRKPETEQPSAIEDEIQVEGSKEEEQHVEFEDELEQPVLVDDVEPEQEQPEKIQQESDIQPKEEEEPVEPQEKREPAQEGSAVTAEEIHKEQLKEELPVEIVADYGDLKEVDDVVVEEEKEESEQEQPDAECHIREVKEDEQPVEPQDEKVSEKDEIKEEGDVIVEEEKRKPEEALPTDKHYTDSQEEELPVEPQSSDTVAEEYEQREPEDLVEDKDETALEERHMAVTEHPAVVTSGEIVLEDEPFKVGNDVEGEELNVSREAEKDDISIEREVDTIEELKDIEAEVDKEEKHDIPQTTTQETVVEVIQTTSTFEDESIPVDQDREREPEEPCPTETVKEDLEPLENDEFDKDVVSVVTIHEERTVVSLHEEVDFEQHPPKEEKPNLEEKKKQEEEEIIGEEQDLVEEDESKDMPSDEQEEVLEETVPEPSQQHLDEEVRPKDEMYEDQSPTKEQEQHQGLPASHEVDVKSDTEEECQDEFPQEPDITRDDDGREEDFQIEEQVPEDTYEQTRYFEELQNIPEEPEEETSDTQEESSSVVRSETVRTVVTTKQVISSGGIVDEHTEVKVFKDEELIDKTEDFGEPSGETLQGDNFEEEVTPKHDDDASPIMQVEEQFKMSEMPSDETHPEADEAIQSKEVERMEESVPVEEEIEIEMEAVEENIKTEMTPDEEIDVFAQDDTSKDYETIPSSSDHYTQKTEVRVHTEITTSGGTLVHEERKVVEDGEVKVDFKMDTLKADDGASQELLQDEEKQEAQPVGQGEVLSGPEWNVDDEEDNMEDEEDVSSEEGEYMPEIRVDPTSEYVQPKDDTEIDEDGLMVEPDPFTEESDVSMDEREEFAEEEEQRPDGVHVTSKISVTSTQIADGTIVSHTETTRTLHTEQQITSGEQPTDDSGPSEEQDEPEIIHDELLEQSIILESQVCLDSEPKDLTDRPKTPEIADITEHEEFSTYFQDQDHQQPVSDIHVPDADVEVEVPEISPEDDVEMDLPEPPVHPYVDDGEEGVSHERYVYSSTTVVAPNVQHVRSDADWTVTEQTTRVVTKVEERISVPTDLNLDQSPSPQVESVQTPEIQELPDTPDSIPESPLAGIYESERDQPVVGGADEVAAAESEPHENLTEEVPEEQDGTTEPDDAVYVDGPTESDYYDPRLLAQPAASVVADLPQEQEQRDEPTHEQPQDESLEERVSDDVEPQGEQANADVPETDEQRREEDQRLMAEAITIGVLSAVQSTDYQRDDAEQSTSEELQSTEVFSTEASAQEEDNTADIELGDGDSASAVEFQGSPEDEDKEATDTQEGVDSIEDERTERRDSSGDLASGEQTSMTTITTTRTVYRSSAVTSEGQVLDGDELVDSIVKPKSAVEFQGSPEDEDKEATDTQEGVDSIEDERTERIDSSGDLASGEQTSMTTITTTRTVYGSSAVTSEVQVLDGDELVDSIVKPKSAVEFQGSPEDEDKEATDTQEGVDSIEDERTEGRDSSGDLASGEQTSMTTITTTRTVYGSSAVTSEGQVLDGDELVDSIVKPKSAVEFQGSPEDEDKEATDTQEGVDSIEDERTERIDSSGDLASREQTSMTTITTTRTVYGSSAVTSEGQVLDGDELVDSIVKPKSAVEFQGSPEDEDKEATDTQEGVDSIEDERTERIDSSGDLASGEQTSMTTITTTRTVYGSSAVTSEGQVLDGDELVDSIVKPKSAVEFQGSPEDEDKEATDTQEGVDSIENERTEERDSSGDLASGEQTSMTTITTTRTVYRSSAVTSEGQVLDGDELVDSIVKPKSAVEFQGSPEDEDKEATDTQEGVDSIEDERTEGRDSSGDLASGEQTSMTTITTTRTVYGSSAVTSEVQVLDGDELVDSIVKPKAPEEVETADADIKTPQEEEEGKVPDILKKTEESEAMDEGDDHDDVDSPTKPVAVPLGHEGGTTTIVHHTYVVTREQRAMTEPTVSEAFISERQGTEPPVDESFDVSFRKSPDEESRPKMDPAAVQEMADLLNEVGEGEPAADEPGEDEPTGPGVEEDDQRLAEHAPPPQQEATKVKLSPQDEEELQHLWAMDWPEPGEKPISSDPAEKVESAPPGPREESAPPSQTRTTTTFVESAPRPESSLQDQSAPPAPDAGSGSLLINFNPGEHASTGFKMTPDREKELQELWQEDTRDGDEQRRQPEEEDDGPKVQENMAPKGLPPASSQRKFELTEDDQKQLQNFWDEPPVAQVEPQQQQSAPPQQHSAPPPDGFSTVPGDMPFGDDDVTEEVEVEEFEEELPDGTIRKVIRKRIKRSTVQMVPIDMDPADLPPGGSHNIVVHKKVTKNTVVRDGEEVETSENVDTEIEQDGIVTDAADLRDDLQQLVDQFLEDGTVDGAQVILDEREVVDESDI